MALYRWSCVWRLIIIMWRQYFHCMKTWQSRYVIWSLYLSVSIYTDKYLCTSLFDLGKLLNEFILHMLHQKIHWRTISGFRNCCMNHDWLLGNLCDLNSSSILSPCYCASWHCLVCICCKWGYSWWSGY